MKRITTKKTIGKILFICFVIMIAAGDDCDDCYDSDILAFKGVICGFVIIGVALFDTFRYKEMEGIAFDIENQPLLETNEATETVSFACEGTIVSDKVISSTYAKVPCVYYHCVLEEYVRVGKSSKWVVVRNITESIPFYVQDARGRIEIDVRNVDSDNTGKEIIYDDTERLDHKYSEIDTKATVTGTPFKENGRGYRRTEHILEPGMKVFVYGYVEKGPQGLVLREHERHPLIISRKTQKQFIREVVQGKHIIYWIHVLVCIGLGLIIMLPYVITKQYLHIQLSALFLCIGLSLGSVVFTLYNRMVLLRNRMRNARSNVDTELNRRFHLIPRLTESVKGYMKHEKRVQTILAQIRKNSDDMRSASDTNMHSRLVAVLEQYPDLKAVETVSQLMIALSDAEERIAYSRSFYNNTVRNYNTCIEQFPFSVLAYVFRFHTAEYISIHASEQDPPAVDA